MTPTKLTTPGAIQAAMLTKLAGSMLDAKDATKLKFKALTAVQVKALDVPATAPGFTIPYFTIDGKPSKFWRLRYLEDTRKGFDILSGRKALRYVQPAAGMNEVYLPPFVDWRKLAENVEIPLVITEGELKSACATKCGFPTIGLGGVYSFKSAKNKEALLPMLREFKWKERDVYICYDSDAVTNPNVVIAENQLARTLIQLGAKVFIIRLPAGAADAKVGLDDYFAAEGADAFMQLLNDCKEYSASAALHAMNEQVAYVRDPGFVYDYAHKMRLGAVPFTQHAYANEWYYEYNSDGKPIRKQTADQWLKWEHRTELACVTFAPGQLKIVDRKLNLWDGWNVEPKKGDIKPWHELMEHLFKGAEPEARKWFEQWCAYPLQHPGGKMASAVVFWGQAQGSGKTLVGHTLMRIYGKHSSEITDAEIEDDRFDWAENMQFILADDITGTNNRKLANRLKTMVTQKTLKINQKYIPRYSVPDCINYYFTSNDPDAFYMDDGDRRNFIHHVLSGKYPKDLRVRFVEWRDSEAGAAALFHYLLNLDIKEFDPQAEPFVTRAKQDMINITKSDISAWCSDLKINADKMLKLPGDLFTAKELLMMYDPMSTGRVTTNGMARELTRAGYGRPLAGGVVLTKFGGLRLYIARNAEKWLTAKPPEVTKHYESNRTMEPEKGKKQKF